MIPTRFNRLRLPPFRRVSYIESTGTQYIDTGVAPDFAGGDRIEIDFEGSTYPGAMPGFLGSRGQYVLNGLYVVSGSCVAADASGYNILACGTSGRHTLNVDDTEIINNGISTAMPRRVTCSNDMYIFCLNINGATNSFNPNMRLYDWKYYRAGVLAQHLVPALDKSDVPCLFDEVTRTFKYNAGTGVFNYA